MNQLKYQMRYALPVWFLLTITAWLPDNRVSIRVRGLLVAYFLPNSPRNLSLGRDVTLLGLDKLILGDNVYIAKGCWVNALGGLLIGNNVMIAPYCVLVTTKHTYKNDSFRDGQTILKQIEILHGSWIAAHSTIVQGVKIGKGNLIAANSVITDDTLDYKVYAGVPAREVKDININE